MDALFRFCLCLAFVTTILTVGAVHAQDANGPGSSCATGITAGAEQAHNNALFRCTTTGVTQNWYPEPLYIGESTALCDASTASLLRYNSGSLEVCNGSAWVTAGIGSILGSSAAGTNPQRSGEAGTGLFSPATGVVAVASLGTEALRVTATGSVGIGVSSPDDLVDIAGNAEIGLSLQSSTSTANQNPYFSMVRSRGTIAAPTAVQSGDVLTDFEIRGYDGSGFRIGAQIEAVVDGTPGANDMPTRLEFQVQADGAGGWLGDGSSVPEMVIKSDGRIGIGTAAPTEKLHVTAGGGAVFGLFESASPTNYWENPGIIGQRSRGTIAARTVVQNGDELMEMDGLGYDGNSWEAAAYIITAVDGTPGDDDMPGTIQFYTRADNDTVGPAERMRISSAGNVGIGTTTPTSKLHVYDSGGAGTYRAVSTIETNGEGALSIVNADNTSANLNPEIWLKRARGTLVAPAIVQSGDSLGAIHAYGYDSVDYDIWAGIEFTVDGTPGVNDMPTSIEFLTVPDGSATVVERMKIKNSGNIGIGFSNPVSKLHVGVTTGDDGITVQQSAANSGNVNFRRSNGTLTVPTAVVNNDEIGELQFNAYNNAAFQISALLQAVVDGAPGATNVPGRFVFYTATGGAGISEKMRLTSVGNLGIGTTAPGMKLDIVNTTGDNGIAIQYSGADGNSSNLEFRKTRGTPGSPTTIGASDEIGEIRFNGYDGTTWRRAAQISGNVDGTPGAGDMPGSLLFYTTLDGAADITERMRLTSGGNVGIGTTSPQSTLHVPDGKYAQFEDNNAGAPPAGDCDNNAERGRMSIDTTNNRFYVCNGATRGWDYIALTD